MWDGKEEIKFYSKTHHFSLSHFRRFAEGAAAATVVLLPFLASAPAEGLLLTPFLFRVLVVVVVAAVGGSCC